jgi:hypothetical protein
MADVHHVPSFGGVLDPSREGEGPPTTFLVPHLDITEDPKNRESPQDHAGKSR